MQTNDQNKNSGSIARITKKVDSDYLSTLEHQLKDLWAQYVGYMERNGFDETAKALKEKYFRLYQSYRDNKNWRDLVNN